jgi:hypothetical protein
MNRPSPPRQFSIFNFQFPIFNSGAFWVQNQLERGAVGPRPINTVASARCKEASEVRQPFQRFAGETGKPLKRLKAYTARVHRAEAPVLIGPFLS